MLKVIVVVARDRPELFGYFERVFAGMPDIKVLLDRRAPKAERTRALLFFVHLVEDVHQPLHLAKRTLDLFLEVVKVVFQMDE